MSVTFSDPTGGKAALEKIAGAGASSEAMITRARKLLQTLEDARFPAASVVPASKGRILLEWHAPGFELEMMLDPENDYVTADVTWTGG